MLREVKRLLAERGRMTLGEMALHFRSPPDALEPMLRKLVDKEQISVESAGRGTRCRGCVSACGREAVVYVWHGTGSAKRGLRGGGG